MDVEQALTNVVVALSIVNLSKTHGRIRYLIRALFTEVGKIESTDRCPDKTEGLHPQWGPRQVMRSCGVRNALWDRFWVCRVLQWTDSFGWSFGGPIVIDWTSFSDAGRRYWSLLG